MAERITEKTPEFRGSYVDLAKPRAMKKADGTMGDPTYSIMVVLPKKAASTIAFMAKLTKLMGTVYQDYHGKPLVKGKNYPIKDGDLELNEDGEATHPGCWTFRAGSKFKPSVCDIHGDSIDGEAELYSGAYYRVKVSAYAWKHETGGRGISISLETAMKTKDGEKFGGGGQNAAADFADDIEKGGGESSSMLD